ncbi:hypothetical protein PHMEG_00032755 [Phytophthora megakarya]|uniref:Uncharacterized protein n=1 Tax=Phytophthora megakarya TaxID=4795 RepID=A0A225UU85_9STRA|nr:hypothetical protein PHMEG_00032755 [Phytophthora megakarya]
MAITVSTVAATTADPHAYVDFISNLTTITNSDKYHMKPVHVVHARAQSDPPLWNATSKTFGSKYYTTAESIPRCTRHSQYSFCRSAEQKCTRKNKMKYIVFYDLVFTQTNETLSKYEAEYGSMLPMDGGQCTPSNGTDVFSNECLSLNGNSTKNVAAIGPFIGGGLKDSDPRAPYPDCWWYSFPNNCPLKKWGDKTAECRASTRRGLCDMNTLPDGITCTYNYRILGYVPIDDVVGITAMQNSASVNYTDFNAFCTDGGVEFQTDNSTGKLLKSIPFWANPNVTTANQGRSQKLLTAYANLLTAGQSSQITAEVVANMKSLPTTSQLTTENPPCYQNVKECAKATYGCKRDLYGQLCTKCTAAGAGCVVAPSDFVFILDQTSTSSGSESSASSSGSGSSKNTTVAAKSSATKLVMTVGALVASFGLSFLMG